MSLRWKLFISYLTILGIALLVLAFSTAYVAPANFTHQMNMQNRQRLGMSNAGSGMMSPQNQASGTGQQDINANFRYAVNKALLQAGIATTLAAAVLSWL